MSMKLVFMDIETSGLDPVKDFPVELGITILNAKDLSQIYSVDFVVKQDPVKVHKRRDISTEIHGITKEHLMRGSNSFQIFLEIIDAFKLLDITRQNSVFICQNPSFDRQFFNQIVPAEYQHEVNWPYHWLDLASMFWITQQAPEYMLLSKDNIAENIGIDIERKPHRALQGVQHLIECYKTIYMREHEKRRTSFRAA